MIATLRRTIREHPRVARLLQDGAAVVVVCMFVLWGYGFLRISQVAHKADTTSSDVRSSTVRNCEQVERVKGAIRNVIEDELRKLGRKGEAGYTYYRRHPLELRRARVAQRRSLRQFAPLACGTGVTVKAVAVVPPLPRGYASRSVV